MKDIIVGTAGHIDHGKTALVKALTGIDADRLAEEKRRGITIDLGFAHLQLTPDLRLGFVDVPGHERFVRNMLAGAGGIDLVLFVIAADESIKPQTREHFEICRLLGIREGIIALTKSDLVDPDIAGLVRLEAEEFVGGSFLAGAPIIPVSAVSGAGLDHLRTALRAAAERIGAKDASGPARLPIDRSFSIRGFGTVATGTLISGSISRDREMALLPSGRLLRVRGVQSYGTKTDRADAGTRTAVNLNEIEAPEIHRGMVLAEPGFFEATRTMDASVELLKSARRLKHRAPVHFHAGTAEVEAEVRLSGKEFLGPGETGFARFRLKTPLVLAPGDRFILRQFSPVVTIGGGVVLDIRPPSIASAARFNSRLTILQGDDPAAKVAMLLEESRGGLLLTDLAVRLGRRPEAISRVASQAGALLLDAGWVVAKAWVEDQRSQFVRIVEEHHRANPLSPGMPKPDLKARTMPKSPAFLFDAVLHGVATLAVEGDQIRRRTHEVTLNADDERVRQAIIRTLEQAGLAAPPFGEVLASTGWNAARAKALLQMLLRSGELIRVNEEWVLHRSAVQSVRDLLETRRGVAFTVSEFKTWTGISRKYAVPLLEYCDRERLTQRNGDSRSVLAR